MQWIMVTELYSFAFFAPWLVNFEKEKKTVDALKCVLLNLCFYNAQDMCFCVNLSVRKFALNGKMIDLKLKDKLVSTALKRNDVCD